MATWNLRAGPVPLVRPVQLDPKGINGPTPGQARGPAWRRTSPGQYVPSTVDGSVVEQRILEASCRLPPSGAVSGWAALRLHGVGYVDGVAPDGRTLLDVPLVVPPGVALRRSSGVEVHRERLPQTEVTRVHGIPVTVPVRATFDAVRRSVGLRAAVVAIDMAVAAGIVSISDLRSFAERAAGWHGVPQVIRALVLADPRSMSPQETRLRLIWRLDAKLPEPRCNWPVADRFGNFIGRPDLLSQELAVVGEFDGAEHRSRARHRDDLRRDDAFRAVGLEPFRVVGADLHDPELVIGRIKDAIARAEHLPKTFLIKAV